MRSLMKSVLSQLISRSFLFFKYFSRRNSFQEAWLGVLTKLKSFLLWLSGAEATSNPVSSLMFNRFLPVVVLASLETILATTATSRLGLSRRDLKNLGYLPRICCLMDGRPEQSNSSLKKVSVLRGTSHASFTHVFQVLYICSAWSP